MTDPIADMFIRIKNAQGVQHESVDIPYSKIKEGIAKLLVAEGYLSKVDVLKRMEKQFLRISLKYAADKKGIISELQRVSKSGKRIYADTKTLPRVQGGFGTAIISTSLGLMTDEAARSKKVGGEVVGYVW